MTKIQNEPTIDEQIVVEVRDAIEHRATWMYLLMDEARKQGLDWDEFARNAISRTGCIHGAKFREMLEDKDSMEEFASVFAVGTGRKVFEMEVLEEDEEKYYLDFHYCPLVKAWQKLGLPDDEIEHLCDIAMDGDRGIGSQFPAFEFTLGETIAQGHPVCQIRFDKKKA
jgi:hypothetical protein